MIRTIVYVGSSTGLFVYGPPLFVGSLNSRSLGNPEEGPI